MVTYYTITKDTIIIPFTDITSHHMGNKGEYEIPPDSAVLAPVYPLVIDDLMCSEYLVTTEGVKLNALPSSTSPIDCSCSPLKHDMGVLIVERYHVILS